MFYHVVAKKTHWFHTFDSYPQLYLLVLSREFSGMIHWLTINNHPSNPQQPIHSLRKTHQ